MAGMDDSNVEDLILREGWTTPLLLSLLPKGRIQMVKECQLCKSEENAFKIQKKTHLKYEKNIVWDVVSAN